MQDKVYSRLGLAEKAGRIASGGFLTEKTVKEGKAEAVIIAADCSRRTAETIRNKCSYYRVPSRTYGTKEGLGKALGKESRSCAAVLDRGFADSILQKIDETDSQTDDITDKKEGEVD